MTTERDIEHVLDRWFDDGPSTIATPVVDAALQTVATTPQVLAGGRLRWRPGSGSSYALAGLAAAAAVVVAVGAFLVGPAMPILVGGPSPSPTDSAAPTPSPSPAASPASAGLIAFLHCDQLGAHYPTGSPRCSHRVWLVGANGADPHPLLGDGKAGQGGMAWSPDGHGLAIVGYPPDRQARLFMTDVAGSDLELIDTGCHTPCDAELDPAFSPDGRSLAFVRYDDGGSAIATTDLTTGRTVVLKSTQLSFGLDGAEASGLTEGPQWSPDSRRIAFSRYDKTSGEHTAVYVLDADGSNLRRVTPVDVPARDPAWSPDGSRIAFSSWVESIVGDQAHTHRELYTILTDGTGLRQLTSDPSRTEPVLATSPSWLPDGRIRFVRVPQTDGNEAVDGASQVWVMDADGSSEQQVSVPPILSEATEIKWQPGS